MSELTITSQALGRRADGSVRVAEHARDELRTALLGLLHAVATATGREPFYTTRAQRHALGTGVAGGLRTLTDQAAPERADQVRLEKMLGKYLSEDADRDAAWQCVNFILGGRREYTLPLLRAFVQAKSDLDRGAQLPV